MSATEAKYKDNISQPAPKYHTKGCSHSSADSPGARTLVFAAFEPFHSCEFRASIALTPFSAILWRSPNSNPQNGSLGKSNIVLETAAEETIFVLTIRAGRPTPRGPSSTRQRQDCAPPQFELTLSLQRSRLSFLAVDLPPFMSKHFHIAQPL